MGQCSVIEILVGGSMFDYQNQEFDTLIGATALVHHLPCVTNNIDHYQRFHEYFGLEIHNWMDATYTYFPKKSGENNDLDMRNKSHEAPQNEEGEDEGMS